MLPDSADSASEYEQETVFAVNVTVPVNGWGPVEIDKEPGSETPGASLGESPVSVTVPLNPLIGTISALKLSDCPA